MDIFVGSSYNGVPTAQLKKNQITSFKDFCTRYLSNCLQGNKNEYYITIGNSYSETRGDPAANPHSYLFKNHYHRNNASQVSAWLLPFDGDNSKTKRGFCIDPVIVHDALKKLGYNHVIYTTHSNALDKHRWRLFVPCALNSPTQLDASVVSLYKQLEGIGCNDLAMSTESKTWSIPWFLPTRDNPEDGYFHYYSYFRGRDFLAVDGNRIGGAQVEVEGESRSIKDMLRIIAAGEPDSGLHKATRDLAYGLVKDGLAPGTVKAILGFLTNGYSGSKRQDENKNKIDPMVDSAVKSILQKIPTSTDWECTANACDERIFTDYPDQSGVMEQLIDACMKWMPYPNRQIAVMGAHTLISTLGGRVYTMPNGRGIVLTALVTGRSTIGKSFIKKFCIFCLNNFQLANVSQDFVGSHFYTSSRNLVGELEDAGSLLSVRTESGQSDKSSAGDMTRVLMYELELATESGRDGYVSSGGQNDKIPSLYSPAVTTIRESVAQIQNEADVINATSISGVAGRRSHVIIDPIKAVFNEFPIRVLPQNIKKLVLELYILAANEQRKKITDPLPEDLWIELKYKNPQYLAKKRQEWLEKENRAAADRQHFESTFYGRMGERLPSWAARLAICDNIKEPIITSHHIDVAEASLMAELKASAHQEMSGELDSDINQSAAYIVNMFKGDMTKNKSLNQKSNGTRTKQMLANGACELHRVMARTRLTAAYKRAAAKTPNVDQVLLATVKTRGLVEINMDDAKKQFDYGGRILKRV